MDSPSRSNRGAIGSTGPDYVFKLIIIGDTSCGKSALLHQFVEGRFKDGAPKHTIGVEFGTKVLSLTDKTIKLHIWDTSGQERFRSVTHSYYRGALGALIVYDVSNRATFESLKGWLSDVRSLAGSNVSLILCGNKSDLADEDREISLLEGSRFAQENDCMFLETSALNGANVDEVFYKCARTVLNKIDLGVIDVNSPMAHAGQSLRSRQQQQHKEGGEANTLVDFSKAAGTTIHGEGTTRLCC